MIQYLAPCLTNYFQPFPSNSGQRSERNVLWESCPKRSNFCLIVWQNIHTTRWGVICLNLMSLQVLTVLIFCEIDRIIICWWGRRTEGDPDDTTTRPLRDNRAVLKLKLLQYWAATSMLQGWTQKGRRCTHGMSRETVAVSVICYLWWT